ncbi:alanine--tRNA ligase [Patescibacteria group bacterium]|nr:MAG: alanine--tRNA ligase [Patescibacteria group bacterium]
MTAQELRNKFLDFFKSKGHVVIPSASLVPENDPTVLFTTAGMHPLVPFLLGQPHPAGNRLVNFQKCLRTDDIDEVGDSRHNTFFEMLGNWSLGDYFKKEAIEWSFEFLTSKDWLGLDPNLLFVSVFEGDKDAPRDDESIAIWREVFKKSGIDAEIGERIFMYPKKKNWWGPAGLTGPCGPCSEMFYFTGIEHDPRYGEICHINCDCGRYLEIWNDVFMEYEKKPDGSFEPLEQKNVDTGMGLERITHILQKTASIYETDLFWPIIQKAEELLGKLYQDNIHSFRIVADHLRASVFLIADGVSPSNIERGYILRRLIRRAIRHWYNINISLSGLIAELAKTIIDQYGHIYPALNDKRDRIWLELTQESEKFSKTIGRGIKEFDRMIERQKSISGIDAFNLYQTYGFPLEMTMELAREKNIAINKNEFSNEFKKHQELSRAGSEQKFKGGLADHSEITARYHTATHLLHQALRDVLGHHVFQKGSNITAERMRFDFSHPQKMTLEEIKKTEDAVNEKIKENLNVRSEVKTINEAKELGAIGLFEGKYGENVSVYSIGDYSKEICGGPHIKYTGEIGKFRIIKEEAVSAGVRRIKAVIE